MEKENGSAPKPKKKPSGKVAPKKKASGKAAPKKKAAGIKTGVKKAAIPKASSSKKKAPGRKTAAKKAASKKKAASGACRVSQPKPESPETAICPADTVASPSEASVKGASPAGHRSKRPMDPNQKIASIGIGVLVLLLALVVWSSASNVGKYYMKMANGEVEIWKGRFSPRGAEKIFTLDRAALPADLKEVYGKEEAFPLIFEGIVNNTDALLNREEMPGFDFIRRELTRARPYAVTDQMSDRLQSRLDKIDMMALVYKADVLAGKGTTTDLKRARETLEKALGLNLDEAEKGLVEQKIAWIDQKL